ELVTGGLPRLWEMAREYLTNLKETIQQEVQSWLIGQIIKAAMTKLLSLFNPVGAIIQAIMMIYNTVMFFLENINRILQFVQAVIDSIFDMVVGAIDKAANWIEKALARMIPILIAFLARLLGVSGITDKIKSVIKNIQDKVDKAIDKVIEKVVGGVKKLIGKLTGKKDGKPDERTEEQKKADLHKGVTEAEALMSKKGASVATVNAKLP